MSQSTLKLDFLGINAESLLREHNIALKLSEAQELQKQLGRPMTLCEATIFGIQLSEHCSYKSSRPFLQGFPTSGPTVLLGPCEDAGVLKVFQEGNETYCIAVGHESHNHPSQVVPYEGAATGIGGIVRDIMCMGAKPVGSLDNLRLGNYKHIEQRNIASGVVQGIAGYSNPLGVPNIGGDVFFDKGFNENCLVNVTALGVLRESDLIHSYVPEQAAREEWEFVLVGKPTDNSGFGGASFASGSFEEDDDVESKKAAVQEPNPFLERHLLASIQDLLKKLKAEGDFDKIAFKDLGAGGVVCATVEIAEGGGFGAEVDLKHLHVAREGFPSHVIACSETQERFCFACHPSITSRIVDHFTTDWELGKVAKNAGATVIGKVRADGQFVVKYGTEVLCDVSAKLVTQGILYDRPYKIKKTPESIVNVTFDGENICVSQ